MPTELTFSFTGADVTKGAIEAIAMKYDLSIEYRAGGSSHLLVVRKGGIIPTIDIAEAESIVLINAYTHRAVILPIHAIRIIRVIRMECEEDDPLEGDWESYKLLHQWIEPYIPGEDI